MCCHGSYMSLFDACVLAIAMFDSGQMRVYWVSLTVFTLTSYCNRVLSFQSDCMLHIMCCNSRPWYPE